MPLESPVEHIPKPDQIRERLAALARERLLLKDLLKLSRRKQQQLPQEQEAART
jgi:hypothetical protein